MMHIMGEHSKDSVKWESILNSNFDEIDVSFWDNPLAAHEVNKVSNKSSVPYSTPGTPFYPEKSQPSKISINETWEHSKLAAGNERKLLPKQDTSHAVILSPPKTKKLDCLGNSCEKACYSLQSSFPIRIEHGETIQVHQQVTHRKLAYSEQVGDSDSWKNSSTSDDFGKGCSSSSISSIEVLSVSTSNPSDNLNILKCMVCKDVCSCGSCNPLTKVSPSTGRETRTTGTWENQTSVRPADLTNRLAALVQSSQQKKPVNGGNVLPPLLMENEDLKKQWNDPFFAESGPGQFHLPREMAWTNQERLAKYLKCPTVLSKVAVGKKRKLAAGHFGRVEEGWIPRGEDTLPIENSEAILRDGLLSLGEAIISQDEEKAQLLDLILQKEANSRGSVMQRILFYFMDALTIRTTGRSLNFTQNSLSKFSYQAYSMERLILEFGKKLTGLPWWVSCANSALFDAVARASHIHIVDFGLWGVQWPPFFKALAERPEGPPFVKYTAVRGEKWDPIAFGPVFKPLELRACVENAAMEWGIALSYKSVVTKVENFRDYMLEVDTKDSVVVNFGTTLSYVPDSSVIRWSPRDTVLQAIKLLNPKLVTICDLDINLNTPFFMPRFKEALNTFWALFDVNQSLVKPGTMGRELFEACIYRCEIVDIIASEGTERVARSEPAEKLLKRMTDAHYVTVPFRQTEGYPVVQVFPPMYCSSVSNSGILRLSYKGIQTLHVSAWRPI